MQENDTMDNDQSELQRLITKRWKHTVYNWFSWFWHICKNHICGLFDLLRYSTKHTVNITYNNGKLNFWFKSTKHGIHDLGNGTGCIYVSGINDSNTIKVLASETGGRVTVAPAKGGTDYAVAIPRKPAIRWAYRVVSDLLIPGDYIGNDSPYSSFGRRLRISKTISSSMAEFIQNLVRIYKTERGNAKGYSPDSYLEILKIANGKHPFALRYAAKPSTRFNTLGYSELAKQVIYKQEHLTNLDSVREFVDFVNEKIIKPNGGDLAWVGIDGKPKFPHPYLMKI